MTRIIAGQWAGRRLKVPAAVSRPTTDRVREAVFSTLHHRLAGWSGLRVLDLYAGSGALGLEALSRGAAWAVFVERDRQALTVLRGNIASLGAGEAADVAAADAARWRPAVGACFDLVFADPPYAVPAADLQQVLRDLAPHLAADALLVVERSARDRDAPLPAGWAIGDQRTYGETAVWYGRAQDAALQQEGT